MNLEDGIKLDYSDVLIRPKRSTLNSRSEVTLERSFSFPRHKWNGVPLMASNMDGVATFEMAKALAKHKILTVMTKHYTVDDWIENGEWVDNNSDYIAVSIGTNEKDLEKLRDIIANVDLKFICIDIANGYSQHFVEHCKNVREEFPHHIIIAGNVVTREITEELILSGVDIVKVGIGPGSVCTTRIKTGVGYPQLSAVDECADAAHGLGGRIVADGGCTCAGDVAKAYAAGADFVMLGGMLSGCKEGGGRRVTVNPNDPPSLQKQVVQFYGMSSKEAQENHSGGLKDYRASEGKCVEVPYKGPVDDIIQDILGGVRSTCTYTGARSLKELDRCATFIRVNNQINNVFGKS